MLPITIPATVALLAALARAQPDLTFFGVSDTHYGDVKLARNDPNRKALPGLLNSLPGQAYPAAMGGGIIAEARGVVVAGDLVDRASEMAQWREYARTYGVDREGEVRFPVYDCLGNHDDPGLAAGDSLRAAYIARNKLRRSRRHLNVVGSDSLDYNYSWDWEGIHFVNLNLYSGSVDRGRTIVAGHSAYRSLDFLRADLARHVGKSGRPVFIMQHYAFDGSSIGTEDKRPWWLDVDAEATYQALKDYNIIALYHGHSHARKNYKWKGFDVFDNGTAMDGDVLVFRIKGTRMVVVDKVRDAATGLLKDGAIRFEKTIALGNIGTGTEGRRLPGDPRRTRFSVAGLGTVYEGEGSFFRADIRALSGRSVRRLSLGDGSRSEWDRNDAAGKPVPAGTYLVALLGESRARALKIVLK